MTRSAVLAEHAQWDIDEARRWYGRQGGQRLARIFIEAVAATIARIEQFPENHAIAYRRLRRARLRRFPILFVVEPQQITVHRCVHLSRDPGRWRTDIE